MTTLEDVALGAEASRRAAWAQYYEMRDQLGGERQRREQLELELRRSRGSSLGLALALVERIIAGDVAAEDIGSVMRLDDQALEHLMTAWAIRAEDWILAVIAVSPFGSAVEYEWGGSQWSRA